MSGPAAQAKYQLIQGGELHLQQIQDMGIRAGVRLILGTEGPDGHL